MKHLIKLTTLLSLTGLLLIMNNSCEPECETCQEPPQASDQTFSVAEESPGGTSVGFITAESTSGDLTYHMVSDIAAHYFVINETTGEITVRDSAVLDYETQQSYTFEAIATETGDDGFSVTLTITINITKIDELKKGLVAYYPFNGNANDESGNGNDGTVNGASLTTDRFDNANSAYAFDGIDDFIYIPHSESIDLDEKISISVWVVLEQINSYNMILAKRYGDTTQYQVCVRGAEGYGDLNFFTGVSKPGNDHDISYSFPTGQWVHMVVTADDISDETKYYINGEYVGTNTSDVLLRSTKTELRIGENTWSNGYWEGTIDDIRIYNRVLDETEIQSLYSENGWTGDTSNIDLKNGLVAQYPFNGNANDESGNGYDGTVSGATLAVDRFGNSNSAYEFDGSDDNIEIGDYEAFESDQFTISVWCKRNGNSVTNTAGALFSKSRASLGYRDYYLIWGNDNHQVEDHQNKIIFYTKWTETSPPRHIDSVIIGPYTRNDWVHITAVKTTDKISLYVDGVKIQENNTPGAASPTSSVVYIGAVDGSITHPDLFFNGLIDDVRFYNRPLNESEINALYTQNGWSK